MNGLNGAISGAVWYSYAEIVSCAFKTTVLFHWQTVIKALTALVGGLGWKMVLNGDLRLFHLTLNFVFFAQTVQTLIRCLRMRRLIWFCTVRQCLSILAAYFPDNHLHRAFWRHTDWKSATINTRYLDFIQTRGLSSLVNDDHVDNNLKEMSVHVYFCSNVNNRAPPPPTPPARTHTHIHTPTRTPIIIIIINKRPMDQDSLTW